MMIGQPEAVIAPRDDHYDTVDYFREMVAVDPESREEWRNR